MKTEINAYRFIAWTLAGFFTGAALLFSLLVLSLNSHPEIGRWVNECLQKKNLAVEQIHPKLVILSGSNALFGFSAERLSNKYGTPTVNAAIHAGLGLNYILNYGKKYIAPGRVFVLPIEYELYGKPSSPGSYAYLYQVVGFDPSYFWNMSITDEVVFTMEIPWADRLKLIVRKFKPTPKNDTKGYQSRNLNNWGDETSNTMQNRSEKTVARLSRYTSAHVFSHNEKAWDAIQDFVITVRSGGGDVVLAYPNIYEKSLDTKLNSIFFSELTNRANEIGVQLIGNPDAARYDDPLLFDTTYHQNIYGKIRATDRLYEDLHRAGFI